MSGNNTVRTAVVNKNGVLTHVHKGTDKSTGSSNRLNGVVTPPVPKHSAALSDQQKKVLKATYGIKPIVYDDGSVYEPGHLVSGHEYRTAIALENKGLATVRYQGKSLGWVKLTSKGSALVNFERITEEAHITDPKDPRYNSDDDMIVAGTTKTYRDMILAGLDPNYEENFETFRDMQD